MGKQPTRIDISLMISPKSVRNPMFSLLISSFLPVLQVLHVQYVLVFFFPLTVEIATSAKVLQLPHRLGGVCVQLCNFCSAAVCFVLR